MSDKQRMCFVIMPFEPELHYFYLYLKQYLESHHNLKCERADDRILTKPILEKINDYIEEAELVLADCTGRNPNVFYELGIAHAYGKRVILISSDKIEEAPSDVRHFEFIQYQLDEHIEFLAKLDNAIQNALFETYEDLYQSAKEVFQQFKQATHAVVELASKEVFLSRVIAAERTREIPELTNTREVEEFILPRIIEDSNDLEVMKLITAWLMGRRSEE